MFRAAIAGMVLLVLVAPVASASKRRLSVNMETAEGAKLKHLTDETDGAKKLQLMEEFVKAHPKHESTTWVLGEMQAVYMKANEYDKIIAAGEQILATDPDDVPIAYNCLKAAEGKKDPGLLKKWAAATSAASRRFAASTKPADAEEAAAWESAVDFAKQTDVYTEYSLYAAASQAAEPKVRIDLGETLEKQNPQSKYVAMFRSQMFVAYQQSGNAAKALQLAEAGLQTDPNNDDMLIFAASKYYEARNATKWMGYARKLIDTLPNKAAPEGVAPADWNRNKSIKLGLAYWMLGVTASGEQKWGEADNYLRAALPHVQGNSALAAETLFHLALANYRIGDPKKDRARINESLKYNTMCAAIASPFQAQARKNIAAIKSAYRIP